MEIDIYGHGVKSRSDYTRISNGIYVRERCEKNRASRTEGRPIYFRTGYMKDRPARSVSFGYSQVDANQ